MNPYDPKLQNSWTLRWNSFVQLSFKTEVCTSKYNMWKKATWLWSASNLFKLNSEAANGHLLLLRPAINPELSVPKLNHCVFHLWAKHHGTAWYTELWSAEFVRCWLTDNKLCHQSKGLHSHHNWWALFALTLCWGQVLSNANGSISTNITWLHGSFKDVHKMSIIRTGAVLLE